VRALVRNPNKAHVLDGMGAELFAGDITDPPSLARAVDGVDVVFHAAALVSNWAPWSEYLATTVGGTENLLAAASRVRIQRFVHISTIRVYDDRHCRRHGVALEDAPQGEFGYRPFGHYARAKVLSETAVWKYADRIPVSVIRPAWIYGPRDNVILPPLIRFLRDPNSVWPGDGNACADPVYVTDVAECALAAAVAPAAIGQAYNAAPHQRITVCEFLGALGASLRIPLPTRSIPYFVANGAAHLSEWWATLIGRQDAPTVTRAGLAILTEHVRHDPGKAARDLGWRKQVDLPFGIESTAAWLRQSHPELLS